MNKQEDEAKNVTIQDVAEKAGVAMSTASMALNNKSVIHSETKKVVIEAAQDLGYHPTAAARALVNGKSSNLGLLIPVKEDNLFSSTDFFQKLISGMSKAAKEAGNLLSLQVIESRGETKERITKTNQTKNVSGSIITHPTTEMPYLDVIEKLDYPVVFLGEPPRDFPYVDNDNFEVARAATEHLIQHGHERIGFLGGLKDLIATRTREKGYKAALEEAKIRIDPDLIWNSEHTEQSAYKEVISHKKLNFTAICISVEEQMAGVYRALRDLELSIPEDVGLITIGDPQLARSINPTMTVVDLHTERLGYLAMKKLIGLTNEERVASKETIQGNLIRRESCEYKW